MPTAAPLNATQAIADGIVATGMVVGELPGRRMHWGYPSIPESMWITSIDAIGSFIVERNVGNDERFVALRATTPMSKHRNHIVLARIAPAVLKSLCDVVCKGARVTRTVPIWSGGGTISEFSNGWIRIDRVDDPLATKLINSRHLDCVSEANGSAVFELGTITLTLHGVPGHVAGSFFGAPSPPELSAVIADSIADPASAAVALDSGGLSVQFPSEAPRKRARKTR